MKVTAVAPVNAAPVIVTAAPALPAVGLNEETVGITLNAPGLVPLPAGVVTVMGPLSAPDGTVAVSVESETPVKAAAVLLKVTAVAPVKPLPLMMTGDPTLADVGERAVIVGAG